MASWLAAVSTAALPISVAYLAYNVGSLGPSTSTSTDTPASASTADALDGLGRSGGAALEKLDNTGSAATDGLSVAFDRGMSKVAVATMVAGGAIAAGLLACAWALVRLSSNDSSSKPATKKCQQ
ncbi:hypothetical protein Agub_g12913 [Astrephomene gubernaculifera]|uniref:Uncharacterized protein n=1 Tax=Astrephomene gubernaculifera TaxID=47775 RepID=A0AAD3E0Z9_9CHLO|nr:hypothetical protein Agub_g12913 [Astrephomene gubernaculifera]